MSASADGRYGSRNGDGGAVTPTSPYRTGSQQQHEGGVQQSASSPKDGRTWDDEDATSRGSASRTTASGKLHDKPPRSSILPSSSSTGSGGGASGGGRRTRDSSSLHQPHGAPVTGPTSHASPSSSSTVSHPASASVASSSSGGGGGGGSATGYGVYGTYHAHPPPPVPHHHPHHHQQLVVSLESPLPPIIQRGLGDRANEKRKNAALEIEALVKSLQEAQNFSMVHSVIGVLSKDFCTSMNANYRKGGLVGLAATAIGLMQYSREFLNVLLPPILHCFDDPEARVRYYACESLYNVAKVSRQAILPSFNQIFEGLTKLYADVDVDVKNGADLLCRLIKDIVTEADNFSIDSFLPLLQNYIRRTNPYIRQLIVGWITLLDSIPDMNMLDYLPDFLDGLFNMLSDSNREIRQAADSALSDFLREVTASTVMDFGPMVSILVAQCQSRERLNRLTAITWIAELIHHPHSGGDALLSYHSDILGAILSCINDAERDIRGVADRTNNDLMSQIRDTSAVFELKPLLDTLTNELLVKEDVPTKLAALGWINMLMEKRKADMKEFTEPLLPVLLRTLSDPSDAVVLLDLQVLSRISLANRNDLGFVEETKETQFQLVLNAILNLFAQDRQLLETRGSLIIRKLCVLLNAKAVYIRLADTLSSFESGADEKTLQFISTMVQTLNLILLTASELHDLRSSLAGSFQRQWRARNDETGQIFANIFHCWCHNPVATFSLCLLAQAYDLSFALVKRFAEMEDVTVGFLMQIDNLVHLLESPIFVHLRLQLLDVEAPYHAPLLKSIYGILMCLPQGDAFRLLNERLTTVCNLRDTLGIESTDTDASTTNGSSVSKLGLDMGGLLDRYDSVTSQHLQSKQPAKVLVPIVKETEEPSPRRYANHNNDSTVRPSTVKSRLLAVRAKQDAAFASSPRRHQLHSKGSSDAK